jgi:hypothetical protein
MLLSSSEVRSVYGCRTGSRKAGAPRGGPLTCCGRQDPSPSRSQPHLNVSRESCLALPRVKIRRRIRDASLVFSTGHA